MEMFSTEKIYDFMSKRFAFLGLSSFLIIASIVLLLTKGLNFGIDFVGGTIVQVKYEQTAPINQLRDILKETKYSNAMRAILDSNITTLLAAVILYAYGTGPIKGFAITISIGILTSMLTAILGTHGIYELLLPRINKDKNLRKWFGVK